MQAVDSQIVPAILLLMTGPVVLFLLWVLFSLQREIQRGRARRDAASRADALREHLFCLRHTRHENSRLASR